MVIQNHSVVHCIYLLVAIKPFSMFLVFPWFWIPTNVSSMNPRHHGNSCNWLPKATLSKDDGQQISSARAWLMHDAMNITSSHNDDFAQFHMKASQMVTLLCLLNNMKHKSYCLGPNFDSLPMHIDASPSMIQTKILDFKTLNSRTYP